MAREYHVWVSVIMYDPEDDSDTTVEEEEVRTFNDYDKAKDFMTEMTKQ